MRPKHDDKDQEEATQQHPKETVDALGERVFGRPDSRDDQDQQDQQDPTPAIEQNLDSDELGSAAAGTEPPD